MSFLKIQNLSVDYKMRRETVYAAKNVNIDVNKGEILGFVGESGAGKSMTGSAIIGLIDPPGYIEKGEFSNSVLKFDPETNQFNSLTQLPIGLMLPAFVLDGEWLYLFGGEDAPEKRSNRAFRAFLPNGMNISVITRSN